MKLALLIFSAGFLVIMPGKANGASFCYDETQDCGPNSWGGVCNTGRHQSPINFNISNDDLSKAEKVELYYSKDYGKNQAFILKNNGHTIQASVRADLTSTSFLQGGQGNLANKRYIFSQIHFHWGSKNNRGSEHKFNDAPHAMEGHFVHYSSEFSGTTEAIKSNQPNALAVFGVVYDVSNVPNAAFDPILKVLSNVKNSGHNTTGTNLNLLKLLPKQTERFYDFQYNGSLTTPDCAEVVLWNSIKNTEQISETQLQQFREVLDEQNKPMQEIFRPIQQLNNRKIQVYEFELTRGITQLKMEENGGIAENREIRLSVMICCKYNHKIKQLHSIPDLVFAFSSSAFLCIQFCSTKYI
ncbi:unnamed protein product [Allacma fusca]|uniref:Alpha-carbonic anhydrase domain-containing protein n=1 Tax=Allacma fusca TaxID=39272 RepID=A0A8J2L9E6_9HEXA|nr:unnamed protein product [Allacma fusca]